MSTSFDARTGILSVDLCVSREMQNMFPLTVSDNLMRLLYEELENRSAVFCVKAPVQVRVTGEHADYVTLRASCVIPRVRLAAVLWRPE